MQDAMMNEMGGLLGPEMGAQGMSDVDMAVDEAAMMGGMDDMGFGVEMASEEEHMMLEQIMDFIVGAIHGQATEQLVQIIREHPTPFEGIAHAAHTVIIASYMKGNEAGLEQSPDIYLAENGVVQETVELMWELASAVAVVDENDDEMLTAAYFDTMRLIGETLLEGENPEAIASAQELLMEMELDRPVEADDYMNEMPYDDMMGADMMQGDPGMPAGGGIPAGGMPPMGY